MTYPECDKTFIDDTDASNIELGGVLLQIKDGNAFSKALFKEERNYSVNRRELPAYPRAFSQTPV